MTRHRARMAGVWPLPLASLGLPAARRRAGRLLRRQDAPRHRRARGRRHRRHLRAHLRRLSAQAHPRQSDHHRAEHAGRRRQDRDQPRLRARGARRAHDPLRPLGPAGAGARRPGPARALREIRVPRRHRRHPRQLCARATPCPAGSRRRPTSPRPRTSRSARSTTPTFPGCCRSSRCACSASSTLDRRLSRRQRRVPGDAARRGPGPLDQHHDLPRPQRRLRQVGRGDRHRLSRSGRRATAATRRASSSTRCRRSPTSTSRCTARCRRARCGTRSTGSPTRPAS